MKIKRSILEQMIREEFRSYVKSLVEAPKGPDIVDSESEKKAGDDKEDAKKAGKEKKPGDQQAKSPKPAPKKDAKAPDKEEKPAELPVGEDPAADAELEKDAAGEKEDASEVTGGKIADEIQGKTVQSITMEPKSKTLPGAQELILTFNEIPDPLKILVTKSGQVKFFFRGLHNEV